MLLDQLTGSVEQANQASSLLKRPAAYKLLQAKRLPLLQPIMTRPGRFRPLVRIGPVAVASAFSHVLYSSPCVAAAQHRHGTFAAMITFVEEINDRYHYRPVHSRTFL